MYPCTMYSHYVFSTKHEGKSDISRNAILNPSIFSLTSHVVGPAFDTTGFHVFQRFIPLAILQRLTLASFLPTLDTSCLLRLQAFLRLTPVVRFLALNSCTRTLHRLYVFTWLVLIVIFPRLTKVAYLPARAPGFGFHVFPRSLPVSGFTFSRARHGFPSFMFSRAWYQLHD